MTIDTTVPRSRRALLAGALGGLAVLAADALGRPSEVRAGVDGDVVLGGSNLETTPTRIENSSNGNDVTQIVSTSGLAIYASSEARAIVAVGGSSNGLLAQSTANHGVLGQGFSTATSGVAGQGYGDGTGLLGYSGVTLPAAKAKTGVYGSATQDSNSRGVWGYSPAGRGVFGESASGFGVRGYATSGDAVSAEATTGYAIRAKGRVRLDRSAGIATIAAGTSSVVVTPGIDLTSTSAVLATLQATAGGTTTVHRVVSNTTANTFTIYLTANAASSVKAAWLVLG